MMLREKMETLIFALIASYNAHRQQKWVVAEPEEFSPLISNAEKLRGQQAKPIVKSTGGIRATNRLTSSTMDSKSNLDSPQTPFLMPIWLPVSCQDRKVRPAVFLYRSRWIRTGDRFILGKQCLTFSIGISV